MKAKFLNSALLLVVCVWAVGCSGGTRGTGLAIRSAVSDPVDIEQDNRIKKQKKFNWSDLWGQDEESMESKDKEGREL